MKRLILLLMLTISSFCFAQINIKIFEPIRFNDVLTNTISKEEVVGEGIIEIYSDDLEEDLGKKLKFYFPKKGLMTNRKKWVKIKEYKLEKRSDDFIVTKEREQIKIIAILNKRDIDNGEEAEIIQGEYIGYIPIIVSQYSKIIE